MEMSFLLILRRATAIEKNKGIEQFRSACQFRILKLVVWSFELLSPPSAIVHLVSSFQYNAMHKLYAYRMTKVF